MEERRISEHESLHLIQQMIQVARDDHRENGEGWLIWGWLLFLASIISAVLVYLEIEGFFSWVWSGTLVVGLILYIFFRAKKKDDDVKTYVQELLDRLGTGFFISLFALVAASMISRHGFGFGYYYILYALWMYIHGSAIRFRPLIIGAYVNWIAAICIFLLNDFGLMMIVSAIAILVGYLVPGYMLRKEYRKKTKL